MTYEQGRGGHVVIANPNGFSTTVSITAASGRAITVYTDTARSVSVAMPDTITGLKQYYVDRDDAYVISTKVNAAECGIVGTNQSPFTQYLGGDTTFWVEVDRELAQAAGTAASGVTYVAASGDTTGATDRAAIQAAIDAATAAGGGTVGINGVYWINASLVMKTGVTLVGTGWGKTVIKLATAANVDMITMADGAYFFYIRDLMLDGFKENQTTAGRGIYLNSTASGPGGSFANCTVAVVERVLVQFTFGNAFELNGGVVESRLDNCYSFRPGGNGFRITTTDVWLTDCTSGESGTDGFFSNGQGVRLNGCKSWWSGRQSARGVTTLTSNTGNGSHGYSFSSAWSIQMANCEAQDNSGDGVRLLNTTNCHLLIHCDANLGNGVTFNQAHENIVEMTVGTGQGRAAMTAAINWWGNDETRNRVTVSSFLAAGCTAAVAGGGKVTMGPQNSVRVGTPEALVTTTYAAAITPDPVKGGTATTLTGNVTIANPVADRYIGNTEFEVWTTQDGTGGRTHTWGADYVGMTAADTTAGKINRWRVRCDGAKWRQVSYSAY